MILIICVILWVHPFAESVVIVCCIDEHLEGDEVRDDENEREGSEGEGDGGEEDGGQAKLEY